MSPTPASLLIAQLKDHLNTRLTVKMFVRRYCIIGVKTTLDNLQIVLVNCRQSCWLIIKESFTIKPLTLYENYSRKKIFLIFLIKILVNCA